MKFMFFRWLPDTKLYINMFELISIQFKDNDDIEVLMTNNKLYLIVSGSDDYNAFVTSLGVLFQLLNTDELAGTVLWGGPVGLSDSLFTTWLNEIVAARE